MVTAISAGCSALCYEMILHEHEHEHHLVERWTMSPAMICPLHVNSSRYRAGDRTILDMAL